VAVCGEAAAQPGTAALFVGLGVRELSVAPAAIPKVRGTLAAIAAVGEEVVREAAREAAEATTIGDVRAIVDALLARLEAEAPAR
jgi:phosphoenolpyruvate-protein kinase (PTS system EI component)